MITALASAAAGSIAGIRAAEPGAATEDVIFAAILAVAVATLASGLFVFMVHWAAAPVVQRNSARRALVASAADTGDVNIALALLKDDLHTNREALEKAVRDGSFHAGFNLTGMHWPEIRPVLAANGLHDLRDLAGEAFVLTDRLSTDLAGHHVDVKSVITHSGFNTLRVLDAVKAAHEAAIEASERRR